ncbi:MAG: type II secretion system protein GspE [Candidatus Omnitrophica bacterium]|nr:type II secretion system protein GspE [Candidatus Omnitrophota bacterium]
MPKPIKEVLNELLVTSGFLDKTAVDKALAIQKVKGGSLTKILIEQKVITQKELMSVLSEGLNIPPIDLSKYKVDLQVVKIIPEKIARHYCIVPISRIGQVLTVVMSDPMNIFAMDDIKLLTGFQIEPVLSTEELILEVIDKCYITEGINFEKLFEEAKVEDVELVSETKDLDLGEIAMESQQVPLVKMVNLMIIEALNRRSSDIHIEPQEYDLKVRYRIDGNLQEVLRIPKKNQNAVIARIKIMSGLDITESRLPQDGRFKIKLPDKEVDFRVSVLPVTYGNKIVLRALDKTQSALALKNLGFSEEVLVKVDTGMSWTSGMILITGPTGSGKSTTLNAVLNKLNTPDKHIITIEDPVEYILDGATQIQVKPEIGLNFADGLRSVLRQAPDIVMVGEIRDSETADIAIKASLTGQLVLSTLHTNDAPSAITRLIDMGVEPFLVASSIVMVGAQRLMRKICIKCKEQTDIPASVLERIGIEIGNLKEKKVYLGKGCPHCNNTGYYGRMAILEVMLIDDKIKELIIKRASSDEIKDYAAKEGMSTLREEALKNFLSGVTTLDEVLRITSKE